MYFIDELSYEYRAVEYCLYVFQLSFYFCSCIGGRSTHSGGIESKRTMLGLI
jgi:hypothetical protein